MEIINPSGSKRCEIAAEYLASVPCDGCRYKRVIILPIPSFRDGVHISGTDCTQDTLLPYLDKSTLLCGYALSPVAGLAEERGCAVLDLSESEEFLFKNTEFTSHAALSKILSLTGLDICDLKIGVIGYGRLGASLVRHLLFLGASPTVFSGSSEKRSSLLLLGVRALDYKEICQTELDLLINTAPERLFSSPSPAEPFFDLASGEHYKTEGAISLPSLPEKFYPQSSGKLYAKLIFDYVSLH